MLAAWARDGRPGEELVVAGLDEAAGERVACARAGATRRRAGRRGRASRLRPGMLPRDEYRALLRRARVFVTAARREDYGIAQLEALADGCAARHDALARPVRRAAARARARPAARRRRARDPHRARRPAARLRRARGRARAVLAGRGRPRRRRELLPRFETAPRCGRMRRGASRPSPARRCLARLRSGANSSHERVLATCSGVSHARRAVAMPYSSSSKFLARVGVGVDQDHHARLGRGAGVDLVHVAAVRGGVDLDHRARSPRRPRSRGSCRSRTAGGSRSCGRSGGRWRRARGARSAATMRSVIAASSIPNEVWIEPITQSRR